MARSLASTSAVPASEVAEPYATWLRAKAQEEADLSALRAMKNGGPLYRGKTDDEVNALADAEAATIACLATARALTLEDLTAKLEVAVAYYVPDSAAVKGGADLMHSCLRDLRALLRVQRASARG